MFNKKNIYVILFIFSVFSSFSQITEINKISKLLNSKNFNNATSILISNNFQFIKRDKYLLEDNLEFMTFAYLYNRDSQKAHSFLTLYYNNLNNNLEGLNMQIINLEEFNELNQGINKNYKYIKSEYNEEDSVLTYYYNKENWGLNVKVSTDTELNSNTYNLNFYKTNGLLDSENGYKTFSYGRYKSKYFLKNGKYEGRFESYDEFGSHKIINFYKNGNRNGLETEWWIDDENNFKSTVNYKNDFQEGFKITYKNGIIFKKEFYKNGILDGEYLRYDSNQKIELKANYKNGLLNGDFYDNHSKGIFKNGLKTGTWIHYNNDKIIHTVENIENGKLSGEKRVLIIDGKILDKTVWSEISESEEGLVKKSLKGIIEEKSLNNLNNYLMVLNYYKGVKNGKLNIFKLNENQITNDIIFTNTDKLIKVYDFNYINDFRVYDGYFFTDKNFEFNNYYNFLVKKHFEENEKIIKTEIFLNPNSNFDQYHKNLILLSSYKTNNDKLIGDVINNGRFVSKNILDYENEIKNQFSLTIKNVFSFMNIFHNDFDISEFNFLKFNEQYSFSPESKKNGKYSLKTDSRDLLIEGNFLNDQKNGNWKFGDSLISFKNDFKDGKTIVYNNEKIIKELEYKKDKLDGIVRHFLNDSVIFEENYQNNVIKGFLIKKDNNLLRTIYLAEYLNNKIFVLTDFSEINQIKSIRSFELTNKLIANDYEILRNILKTGEFEKFNLIKTGDFSIFNDLNQPILKTKYFKNSPSEFKEIYYLDNNVLQRINYNKNGEVLNEYFIDSKTNKLISGKFKLKNIESNKIQEYKIRLGKLVKIK